MKRIHSRIRNWSKIQVPDSLVPFIRWMQKFFIELCNNSNIHGLRYITGRFLHWSERLWWIIAVGISLWLCSSMIQNIWIQWNAKPVTIDFHENKVSITTIPFPTVTICPETKFGKHNFDLSSAHKSSSNLSDKGVKKLNALSHICPLLSNSLTFKENFTSENIYNAIQNLALQYDEAIVFGMWKYKELNLVPILTDEGLCFTFNALNSHEMYTDEMAPGMMIVNSNPNITHWSLEHGYEKEFVEGEYPLRIINSPFASGLQTGLKLFKRDFGNQCTKYGQSFKVTLTEPGDVPKMSKASLRISLSEKTAFWLKPKVTTTSDGLRNYKPSQRQCFFNSERRLRFYKIYTQSNCAEECLSNFTKQECGCVKFSMPRDKNTKICGTAKIKCYKESERKLFLDKSTKRFRDECNCLPAFTSIRYDVKDIVRRHFDWNSVLKARDPEYKKYPYVGSVCYFLVANRNVDVMMRMETYTFTNFLAICGGLLGVFLGISALSIIELIYYFTLRLYWTIRRARFAEIIVIASDHRDTNSIAFQYIRMIQTFFMDFCKNSNIHGIRYFTERRLHSSERLWWLIAFGVSVWLCGSQIHSIWMDWSENPMIMSNNEMKMEISTVPFPTITICAHTKVMKTKFDMHIAYNESYNPTESEVTRLNDLSHICNNLQSVLEERNFSRNEFTNESIYDTIRDVAPQINDLFYKCSWQGKVINCSKYFIPILTNQGLCFTFNALNSHEIYTNEMAPGMMIAKDNTNVSHWSLSNGYEDNLTDEKYPFRLGYSGKGSAIDVILQLHERDIYYRCGGLVQGFMIILTTPGEAKSITYKGISNIGTSEEIQMGIVPKMITTSEGLRNYRPEQRQCFYQTERQLRFYKLYTQNNCEDECLANYTRQECGCVPFWMQRDNNTKICGAKSIKCYKKAHDKITEFSSTKTYLDECNCLPSCTLIEYNDKNGDVVKIMTAIKNVTRSKKDINEGTQQTRISIYFKEQQFEVKKRMEKYSFVDFLAICGGLLGLFLGISALSIIELLYYFTLRLFWIIRRGRIENAVVPL